MSMTPVALMFQPTREPEIGRVIPRGNVTMIPAPMVAGRFSRRKKLAGTVGGVPQARAVCAVPAGSDTSSARTVCGVVGETPIAAGRPIPRTEAVAAAIQTPISNTRERSAAPARSSIFGFAMVTFEVRFAILYIAILLLLF